MQTLKGRGMIKLSVLYPHVDGCHFDMQYYCDEHMPMVQKILGSACTGVAVEEGLGGIEAGSPPSYLAMGHLYFDSLEVCRVSFGANVSTFMDDVPNYTDIKPVIQLSEVKI